MMPLFHAYPIEWWQFGAATLAILIHAVGVWDALMTYQELWASHLRQEKFLRILAASGVRTAGIRFLQQFGIFVIGVMAILSPPPPIVWIGQDVMMMSRNVTILRSTLILVSLLSIVKEVWAVFDRHRSYTAWKEANASASLRRRSTDIIPGTEPRA